jgi:hypothetical protein
MTWYWRREGDSIVIRQKMEEGEEGDYVCEFDVRYLGPGGIGYVEQRAEEIVNAHAEIERLKAALKSVEWTPDAGYPRCPACREWQRTGEHAPDCKLAAALNPRKKEEATP